MLPSQQRPFSPEENVRPLQPSSFKFVSSSNKGGPAVQPDLTSGDVAPPGNPRRLTFPLQQQPASQPQPPSRKVSFDLDLGRQESRLSELARLGGGGPRGFELREEEYDERFPGHEHLDDGEDDAIRFRLPTTGRQWQ